MGTNDIRRTIKETEKEFLELFRSLCQTRSSWEVWADFVTMTACAIANSTEVDPAIRERRESEYEACVKRMGGVDVSAQMLAIVVEALERNPEQDFLGNLFMQLNLGNHWKGQFFTPYTICKAMAALSSGPDLEKKIRDKGWVSVNDCACGAGATLIAMANHLTEQGINYQQTALFVAQDVDRIAALMCYIQLSLLGCAGYVVVANSLTNPLTGASTLLPNIQQGQEAWFTPMFCHPVWQLRQLDERMLLHKEAAAQEKDAEERRIA